MINVGPFDAKRVMSGTWGEVWLDSDKVTECFGAQAKVDVKKDDVPMCGTRGTPKKISGWDGKGSLKMNKVNSRMAVKIGEAIRNGDDLKFTVISKLADPAAFGAERVALYGVSFDDLTLFDWEAKKLGETECPFTFEDFEFLDLIQPQ
jgi:hypothetical protein